MLQENEGTTSKQDQPTCSDIFVSVEMSRSKWVVGIHTRLADKIALHTMACNDVEALLALIDRARSSSSRPPSADAFVGGGNPLPTPGLFACWYARRTLPSKDSAQPCGPSTVLLCSCSSGPHPSLAGRNSWSRSPPLAAPYGHKPPALP